MTPEDALREIEAILDARDAGDFSPMMPKIRAVLRSIRDGAISQDTDTTKEGE